MSIEMKDYITKVKVTCEFILEFPSKALTADVAEKLIEHKLDHLDFREYVDDFQSYTEFEVLETKEGKLYDYDYE